MSAGSYLCIVIDALLFQNAFYSKCKESQVRKAYDGHPVRLVNTDHIGDLALYRGNDTATQDHHDQEGRPLGGVFSQTCD